MNNESRDDKKKTTGFFVGVFVFLIVLIVFIMGTGIYKMLPNREKEPVEALFSITTAPQSTTEAKNEELSFSDLLKAVLGLKNELKNAVTSIQDGELSTAAAEIRSVTDKTDTIRRSMNATTEALGQENPLQAQFNAIQDLLKLLDDVCDRLLEPTVSFLENHPTEGMKVGDGVDMTCVWEYLAYAEEKMPDVEYILAQAAATDLSLVDNDGDLADYLAKADAAMELYRQDNTIFSRIQSALGKDSDRVYVLAAQNSAEIRASGGFPGAVGAVRIQSGVLYLDDFKKVYDVFSSYTPASAGITSTEHRLFHGGLSAPRDADYCPDFERVAQIWALGYETGKKENVDGVVSVTPAVVQKLLAVLDEQVVLFDGTVLDGSNATKELQHDLYFKYFGSEYVQGASVVSDQLFADAAKKVSLKIMDHMTPGDILEYLPVVGECFEDRTIMLWAKEEAIQNLFRRLGCSGGLNSDPEKPQIGIYYNCTVASKMGWYLIRDVSVGAGVQNQDHSYTYPVQVTYSNDMQAEDLRAAQAYISGGGSGAIGGSMYFFAPAGGTVSNFSTNNGMAVQIDTYHDLQLGFIPSCNIYPGKDVVISFDVTTAPGVETIPELSLTPTLQEYH